LVTGPDHPSDRVASIFEELRQATTTGSEAQDARLDPAGGAEAASAISGPVDGFETAGSRADADAAEGPETPRHPVADAEAEAGGVDELREPGADEASGGAESDTGDTGDADDAEDTEGADDADDADDAGDADDADDGSRPLAWQRIAEGANPQASSAQDMRGVEPGAASNPAIDFPPGAEWGSGAISVAEAAGQAPAAGMVDRSGEPDAAGAASFGAERAAPPGGLIGALPAPPRHPGAVQHPLPRRLAIANQKGGVGKTTTAVNLGAALAEMGYRVLVVDLDPQGNATTGLGINGRNLDASIYDVILHDVPIEDVIEPTTIRNLFGVPATIDLAGAEIELVPAFSRELRLRRALEPVVPDFDFVLIDCPPSLGLITVNGLAAAEEVVVPIQCEYYALEGLGQLLRNVGLVQTNLNHGLEVSTIILTMYDARTRLATQVVDEVRQHFGEKVCANVVPRSVRLSEAPSFGQPITVFDPASRGAIAYRELAKEMSGGAPQRIR
jgi:chromosome partitioning protein